MGRQEAKCLYVEHKVLGRAFNPLLRGFLSRNRVVAAVDLDEIELRCIEPEPGLWRVYVLRVEAARVDQRLVRP